MKIGNIELSDWVYEKSGFHHFWRRYSNTNSSILLISISSYTDRSRPWYIACYYQCKILVKYIPPIITDSGDEAKRIVDNIIVRLHNLRIFE